MLKLPHIVSVLYLLLAACGEPADSVDNLSSGCRGLYNTFSDMCPPMGELWSCTAIASTFPMCELVCEPGSCSTEDGASDDILGKYQVQGDDEPFFELGLLEENVVYKSLIDKYEDGKDPTPIQVVVKRSPKSGGATIYLASGSLVDPAECIGRSVRFTTIELTGGACAGRSGTMRTLEITGCASSYSAYDSEVECMP